MMPVELRRFVRGAVPFTLIGLAIYALLYAASEQLVAEHALRNRFHAIKIAPRADYDHVLLGASHAAVFDYRDMNRRLETMTGTSILNLSVEGAGISVNRLLLDYFLATHRTSSVVYVIDSFAFYSQDWNEDRLQDTSLYRRAPWDPTLARLLLTTPATRWVAIDYITGFSKINNRDRFATDLFENEGRRFERTYRPVAQIDQQRIRFLYPAGASDALLDALPYFGQLEQLIRDVRSRGIRVLIVRPPIPDRIRNMLPNEDRFDARLTALAETYGAVLHDFSSVNNEDVLFFDSDHLNEDGVRRFFEGFLAPLLTEDG